MVDWEGLDLRRMLTRAVVQGSHREVVFAVLRGAAASSIV